VVGATSTNCRKFTPKTGNRINGRRLLQPRRRPPIHHRRKNMTQDLSVNLGGVKSLGQIHDQVSAAVSQLTGSSPSAGSAEAAYGTISAAFTSALGTALPSRDGTLQATSTSSETIGKLLKAAAQAYEQGDQANAEKLRAAAEALAGGAGGAGAGGSQGGAAGTGASGAGSSGAGSAGGGGAEMAGQMASQVGQQMGQIAQGMAQSAQGLAQGLTQLPQQIMQGVQGMVESATKGGTDAATKAEDAAKEEAAKDAARDKDASPDDEHAEEQRGQRNSAPTHAGGAQPGQAADGTRAPVSPPVPERPQPAQTRPQQSQL
jgi:hypothetical protein